MPSKYIKKGWNPNTSGRNIKLAPFNQAHELGIPRKTYYVPKGFNANSLRNLDRAGKGARRTSNNRVTNASRNAVRQENREARRAQKEEEKEKEKKLKEQSAKNKAGKNIAYCITCSSNSSSYIKNKQQQQQE